MESLGPHSVLDKSDRSSLQNIITDRLTRHRSPGRSFCMISDEDIVIESRIPQPYRTSFSAVARLTRKERSRSLSPASSLKNSRHSSKGSWGHKNTSIPKHVTYNSVVTVRHSDTFDTAFSSDTQFSDAENTISSSQENSGCESLSGKQESGNDFSEQLRAVSRQIQKEYSDSNSRYVSLQFPSGKPPIGCSSMKNIGQGKGRKDTQKDYLHDRTISYRRAVQNNSFEDVVPIIKKSQTQNAKNISSSKIQKDLFDEHETSNTPHALSKQTFSNSIGNFFRRISPMLSRKQSKEKYQTSSVQSLTSGHSLENDKKSRRGSQERIKQSLQKLIGQSRTSRSGSKSENILNTTALYSPSANNSVFGDTKTVGHSDEAKSRTSFNRILKSIEQNSMTEAAQYKKLKENQMPSKQREVTFADSTAGINRAIMPVSSESCKCVSNSKINKENDMITREYDRPEDVPPLLTSQYNSHNMHTNNFRLLLTDKSIGDCSFDINCTDKDASTVNESNRPVASCRVVRNEKELMSYQPTAMSTTVPSVCIGQKVLPLPDSAVTADTNIHRENDDFNSEEFTRTPSYLKVSRAISGYGLYNHYGWYKNIEKRSPCSSSISLRSVSSRELPNVSSQETCVSIPLVESPLHQEHILNGHSAKQMVSGHLEHIYPTGDPVKDGNYYLDITQTEEECLLALIGRTQKDMAGSNLTEEVHGKMRAAVGKANLLIGKKFQQFRQLCELHMNPSETERCTKWDDLQGFWDMVKIQVDDVDEMFMELNYMKQNDWKEIDFKSQVSSTNSSPKSGSISLSNASTPSATPGHTPGSKRKVIKVKDTIDASPERSQKAKQTAKLREEARKRMLAERRSAMKQKSQQALQEVEIFVPVTNTS